MREIYVWYYLAIECISEVCSFRRALAYTHAHANVDGTGDGYVLHGVNRPFVKEQGANILYDEDFIIKVEMW